MSGFLHTATQSLHLVVMQQRASEYRHKIIVLLIHVISSAAQKGCRHAWSSATVTASQGGSRQLHTSKASRQLKVVPFSVVSAASGQAFGDTCAVTCCIGIGVVYLEHTCHLHGLWQYTVYSIHGLYIACCLCCKWPSANSNSIACNRVFLPTGPTDILGVQAFKQVHCAHSSYILHIQQYWKVCIWQPYEACRCSAHEGV